MRLLHMNTADRDEGRNNRLRLTFQAGATAVALIGVASSPATAEDDILPKKPIEFAVIGLGVDADTIGEDNIDQVHAACFSGTGAPPSVQLESVCPNGRTTQTGFGAGEDLEADGGDHDTGVASIIVPHAEIVPIQVGSKDRNGPVRITLDSLARAMEYALELMRKGVIVGAVNSSTLGDLYEGPCNRDEPYWDDLLRSFESAGGILINSTGNNGADGRLPVPVCVASGALFAFAALDGDGMSITEYSNMPDANGPEVFAAQGTDVLIRRPGGKTEMGYGTTYAAAVGARIIAQELRQDSSLTPAQLRAELKSRSVPVTKQGGTVEAWGLGTRKKANAAVAADWNTRVMERQQVMRKQAYLPFVSTRFKR